MRRLATTLFVATLSLAVSAIVASVSTATTGGSENPILNGAKIVGHGFNAKEGRPGLFPVLAWTYQFGNTWTSPVTGTTYQVPDQLNSASIPESATKIVQMMSANYSAMFHEYKSWFKFSFGISDPGVFSAGINYNKELQKVKAEVHEGLKIYGFSQYWCTYYTLDMAPAYMLTGSDFFKLAVSKLPATAATAADKHEYQEFVQAYGTHYVCYGAFGGYVHLDQFLDQSVAAKYSLEQVEHQLSLGFHFYLFNISGGDFKNKTDIHFATWFAEHVQAFSYFNGGVPAYQHNNTLNEWLTSIPDNAGLLNTTLCPLTDLVTWDKTRQASLKGFIHEYLQ